MIFAQIFRRMEKSEKQYRSAAGIFSFSVGNRFHGFRERESGLNWSAVLIFMQIFQRMEMSEKQYRSAAGNFFFFCWEYDSEGRMKTEMRKDANTYFYACVNKKTPDLNNQLDAFRKLGAEERCIFADREREKREIYHLLKNNLMKSGDTLVLGSLYCLGENSAEIIRNLEYFMHNDIRLDILDVPVTFSETSDGNMLLIGTVIIQMLLLFDKQKKPKLPRPHKPPNYPDNWEEVYTRYYIKHEITAKKARELTGLSQYLLSKYIREYTACQTKNMEWSGTK